MAEKTIKHASFWYTDPDGLHQVATRGETVDISEAADLKRGEKHGAFASKEDLAEGSPLAAFIASREASAPSASVMLDPADVESRTSIAGSADPAIQSGMVTPSGGAGAGGSDGQRPAMYASKADWVAYAVTQRPEGASAEDARSEAESMTKADLVARYTGQQNQGDGSQG